MDDIQIQSECTGRLSRIFPSASSFLLSSALVSGQLFLLISSEITSPRLSKEFLFSVIKRHNICHNEIQLVMISSLLYDCH